MKYIDEYFVPTEVETLKYDFNSIKEFSKTEFNKGKTIDEIANTLIENLDLYDTEDETLWVKKVINSMLNDKAVINRITKITFK